MNSLSCPKIRDKTPDQIASFLVNKFSGEKIPQSLKEFMENGFTTESLKTDKNNLFRFLVLVAYDRRPFWPYEIVWDKNNPESIFSVLDKNGILNLDKLRTLSEDDLDGILQKCVIQPEIRIRGRVIKKRLHLNDIKKRGKGIKFAKVIKEISLTIDQIMQHIRNIESVLYDKSLEVVRLHQTLDDIYGFGPTISSKFIMYTIRIMGIGEVAPFELDVIAKHLKNEWRNSKWVKLLEDIGILQEIEKRLKIDPFAFDYFWDLDRYYCSEKKCSDCEL